MTALGLVLLVLGSLVAIAEAHYPTQGVAGSAGVLMLAAGAGLVVALLAGVLLAGAGSAAVMLLVRNTAAVRRRSVRTGAEGLIGHVGVVRSWTESAGSVSVDGALWNARRSYGADDEDDVELHAGDPVVVERLSGLTLSVRPAEKWELPL